MKEEIHFPVYRKYHNNSSYFKILNPDSFIELKRMPGGIQKYEFTAKILPDRYYMHDMIYDFKEHWEEIEEVEFEEVLKEVEGNQ